MLLMMLLEPTHHHLLHHDHPLLHHKDGADRTCIHRCTRRLRLPDTIALSICHLKTIAALR
jgi:hypothetical protein